VRAILSPLLLSAACAVDSPHDRAFVAMQLEERSGSTLRPDGETTVLPPSTVIADGLTEPEAIAIALWNNPAFAAVLADLDVSRGELAAAGMLRNPVLSMLFPLGPKQFEATLSLPLDSLLHRPHRIAAARIEVERVAADLVRSGLDLIRDTQLAFTSALLAAEVAALAAESAGLAQRRATLANLRVSAGDASEAFAMAATVDAGRARGDASRARHASWRADQQLRALLGLPADVALPALVPDEPGSTPPALAALLRIALASRPDLRAAELTLEAASERAGLTRAEVWQIALLADVNSVTREADQVGPGVALEVPLFDQRQGSLAKLDAEAHRAMLRIAALRDTIERELDQTWHDEAAARAELVELRDSLLPASERDKAAAERVFTSGEESEEVLLQAQWRNLEVRRIFAAVRARQRDARAMLERGIGRRLSP